MVHGNLVKIFKSRIEIPDHLLRPSGFAEGSHVSAFYYPAPREEEYKSVRHKIDLGFAPFPFRLWPNIVVISVYLRHTPGALEKITECLEVLKVNILSAHIVRFGHRYAQWSMAVDLSEFEMPDCDEEVKDRRRTFEQMKKLASSAAHAIKEEDSRLIRESGEEVKSFLFRDLGDAEPVSARAIYLLWDHYWRIREADDDNYKTKFDRLFYGRCSEGGIELRGSKWERVLLRSELLSQMPRDEDFLYCVAAFDTQSFMVRAAVIERASEPSFGKFLIKYEREVTDAHAQSIPELPLNTRGLLMRVAKEFGECNLWWTTNRTIRNQPDHEIGLLELLAEAPSRQQPRSYFESLQGSLEKISSSFKPTVNISEVELSYLDR